MSEVSDIINVKSLISQMNNSKCTCNNNSNSTGGFDIAYSSLLGAIAKKEREKQSAILTNANIENNKNKLENLSIQNSNRVEVTNKDQNTTTRIENAVQKASKMYGVDANLIKAIIKVESNFNPNVVSSAGAKGLMQLMPENCKDLGVENPFDIEENIDAGTRHIKEYLDKYNGNIEMALMAYNGGPTRMKNRGVDSPEDIYKMPKETQNYVPKVMNIYRGK